MLLREKGPMVKVGEEVLGFFSCFLAKAGNFARTMLCIGTPQCLSLILLELGLRSRLGKYLDLKSVRALKVLTNLIPDPQGQLPLVSLTAALHDPVCKTGLIIPQGCCEEP